MDELDRVRELMKTSIRMRLIHDLTRTTREERLKLLDTILSDFYQVKIAHQDFLWGVTKEEANEKYGR